MLINPFGAKNQKERRKTWKIPPSICSLLSWGLGDGDEGPMLGITTTLGLSPQLN